MLKAADVVQQYSSVFRHGGTAALASRRLSSHMASSNRLLLTAEEEGVVVGSRRMLQKCIAVAMVAQRRAEATSRPGWDKGRKAWEAAAAG